MTRRRDNQPTSTLDPNGPVQLSDDTTYATQAQELPPSLAQEQEADRVLNREEASQLDENMTMQESDARREVPRLRTDSITGKRNATLAKPGELRSMTSSRIQKDLSVTKNKAIRSMPQTRVRTVNGVMHDPDALEGINRDLRVTHGTRSEITPKRRRAVSDIDRTIQTYETQNTRDHIVYTTLRAPNAHGETGAGFQHRLRRAAERDGDATMTFDGYIPSTHSAGNITTSDQDIVLEMRTRSGMYLGGSDSTPNSDHLVGRGRTFKIESYQENVPYVKPDGTRGVHPVVVQLNDITDDGRTTAKK